MEREKVENLDKNENEVLVGNFSSKIEKMQEVSNTIYNTICNSRNVILEEKYVSYYKAKVSIGSIRVYNEWLQGGESNTKKRLFEFLDRNDKEMLEKQILDEIQNKVTEKPKRTSESKNEMLTLLKEEDIKTVAELLEWGIKRTESIRIAAQSELDKDENKKYRRVYVLIEMFVILYKKLYKSLQEELSCDEELECDIKKDEEKIEEEDIKLRKVVRGKAKKKKYAYQKYIEDLYKELEGEIESRKDEVLCCPEPIEFIAEFENAVTVESAKKVMKELIEGKRKNVPAFKNINLQSDRRKDIWYGNTKKGVNLRVGKAMDGHVKDAVTLGDEVVHGVIVGRTGSGKSVFLNHLIMTLLHEYAPWELDLYLVDLKRVELSRYMSNGYTPHIKTCACTNEIRYVLSMLEHLYACMKAREELLSKLGFQKLSQFRDEYKEHELILPRVVVIIDEFQQVYQEAEDKEGDRIKSLIYSIIKLGRATGFHLLFASQDMSNALNGTEMANFRARFALQCDAEISSSVLGNTAAADLPEPGLVYFNDGGRHEEKNREYRVPYIDDDDKEFFCDSITALQEEAKKSSNFSKQQMFYQEKEQKKIEKLRELLKNEEVKKARLEVESSEMYYDAITLGRGVVYFSKRIDIESFYIERQRKKNVLVICDKLEDLAYIQKLFALNFKYAPIAMQNACYNFCLPLAKIYNIKSDIENAVVSEDKEEYSKQLVTLYRRRYAVKEALKEGTLELCKNKYASLTYQWAVSKMGDEEGTKTFEEYQQKVIKEKEWCQLEHYYNQYAEEKDCTKLFPPINIWLNGIDYLDNGLPGEVQELIEVAMDVNILFLLFASSTDAINGEICNLCEYLFAKSERDDAYDRLDIDSFTKSKNEIAIDFKIKSMNTERAFKKYRVKAFEKVEVPELQFDKLIK